MQNYYMSLFKREDLRFTYLKFSHLGEFVRLSIEKKIKTIFFIAQLDVLSFCFFIINIQFKI